MAFLLTIILYNQISTLDDGSAVATNNGTPAAIDGESVNGDPCDDETEIDSKFDPSSCVEEHLLKRLRKEFNCEALNHDLDEKVIPVFNNNDKNLNKYFWGKIITVLFLKGKGIRVAIFFSRKDGK